MPERRRKFTPEFKDEAVKLVIDTSRPIAEVAREIGVNEGTLGNWVNRYRVERSKRQNREELSTVAGRAGGPVRSSDEAPVMGVERRGRIARGLFVRSTGPGPGGAA